MFTIEAFVDALTLEPVGDDRFRAHNLPSEHSVVFGGQLLAQSVMAGLAGQEGKAVKTIHTVFAREARPTCLSRLRSTVCIVGDRWPVAPSPSARTIRWSPVRWCSLTPMSPT